MKVSDLPLAPSSARPEAPKPKARRDAPSPIMGGRKCPKCGEVYREDYEFCIKDGSPLQGEPVRQVKSSVAAKVEKHVAGPAGGVCPKCGASYSEGDYDFCIKDGTKLVKR